MSGPPGRLRQRPAHDRIEVELPVDLRGAGIVWGALCLFGVVATWMPLLDGPVTGVGLLGLLVGTLVLVGILGLIGHGLAWIIEQMRRNPVPAFVLTTTLLGVVFGFMFVSVPFGLALASMAAFSGAFYAAVLLWLSRGGATLRIGQGTVEVRHRKQTWSLPLEQATPVERVGRVLGTVHIGGQPAPGLGGLREEELAWVRERVEGAARQRREALVAQGEDLAAEARPPAELLARLERG